MKTRLGNQRRAVDVVSRLSRAVAIAWLATGCRQVLGVSGYHVGDRKDASAELVASKDAATGGTYDGVAFKDGACGSCMAGASTCKPALDACLADPACASYVECDALCAHGDLPCESLCMGIYGPTLKGRESWDLLNCRATACAQCGLPCKGTCLGNLGCDQCLESSCYVEGAALARSPAATTALECEATTGSLGDSPGANSARCAPAEDAGADAFGAWNTCRKGTCTGPCSDSTSESDWRCLGKISPAASRPGLDSISFGLFVEDVVSLGPVPFATVRTCKNLVGCGDPQGANGQGFVQLGVDTRGSSAYDYLDIEKRGGTAPIDPTLYYEFPHVTQSGVQMITLAITQGEIAALGATDGAPIEPDRGGVLIDAFSCGLQFRAKGVTFATNVGGTHFYVQNDEEVNLHATDTGTGNIGGFLNVPPTSGSGDAGTLGTFSGYRTVSDGGPRQLVFSVNALVRPGSFTCIVTSPSPVSGW